MPGMEKRPQNCRPKGLSVHNTKPHTLVKEAPQSELPTGASWMTTATGVVGHKGEEIVMLLP